MEPSIDFVVALIPIAPFLAAFLAPLLHRFVGPAAGWVLAIVPASIFISLLGFIEPIAHGESFTYALDWLPAMTYLSPGLQGVGIQFSFFIDGLSLTFGLLISGIGTIIVVYSGSYLAGHRQQGRFLAFILMFMGSMLGLVLADDLIVLFIFWELTSITSFLLIGFDHARQASRRAAIQALVITGGGGLVMLAGIALLHLLTFDPASGQALWKMTDFIGVADLIRQSDYYLPILLLFLAGAFTKSAQFPFHFWLPNAMEAPTPVSAFLHSATMVKAGIYLLARMSPIFANGYVTLDLPLFGSVDFYAWNIILTTFGGVTLLWGAVFALKQTDIKQMLAQTTIASLGLLVLLLGVGTELAVTAAVIYLVAHAFYKAALFLVAGLIDHGTGTREITELGGLRAKLPFTFAAAVLAAISMAGLPTALGFFAKEEMYAALIGPDWHQMAVLLVLFVGNALMMAVGLSVAITPFFGALKQTPHAPHEGAFAMWAGPVLLGVLAMMAGFYTYELGHYYVIPTASTIYNFQVDSHLSLIPHFNQWPVWISIATWIAGVALFMFLPKIRVGLQNMQRRMGWTFDDGFDASMFGLIKGASMITRLLHHGRLEIYLVVVFVGFALAVFVPQIVGGGLLTSIEMPVLTFYEWGVIVIALAGLVAVLAAGTRLVAIASLGIQGFAIAMIFMLFGAPDLSFTQFMVEILSVVILALVMTRLHLDRRDRRVPWEILRDGFLALVCGVGVTMLLLLVLQTPLDMRLTEFFAATSTPIAHGHNIVNVILVDYRGLDTLGEISVVMTAGVAILALIRMRGGGPKLGIGAKKSSRRRARKGASA